MEAVRVAAAAGLRLAWTAATSPAVRVASAPRLARACSTIPSRYDERDPAPLFFDSKVQEILKRVTGRNYDKIFRRRYDEKKLNPPKYEFLTEEELGELKEEMEKKAETLLQMPPVVKQREPIQVVLSRDPALTGFDTCRYVFTDITYGVPDRRLILVRDTDGTLRQASWEERDRMNQIYNPQSGRKIRPHRVFEEENLKNVLDREEYEFVLDLACAQFEPDDPEYQQVTGRVYETLEARRCYQALHSTRHYGPLCFYLAWNKKIDNLLTTLIQLELLSEGADIVRLYYLVHPDSKSAGHHMDLSLPLETIKMYMEQDSLQRAKLQLAIQAYQEIVQQRHHHQEDVKAAHGL
ncbi:28S ribosomal protein S22, mitochondrial [Portunus trituberculatus]|uniref:28S ribosomal protein S22, mitochondrial n=1 Tax=Portunus trituberculatus TaxID=210409 RepID=A0A5B7F1Z3_PORTR|nr:28S ribosomal protein S22, mitochondrial [Portunus trituberculatus]